MTILIADNSPRISYTATSGQTAFTVPFEFFDNTDLNVYINDTLQTLTTHYTVTGGDGSTGSITLVTGATAGDIVVITRDVTLERTTDFPSSGPFQVASLNTELDKVVAMIADMKDLADRGLRLSDSDTSAALVVASKDDRKGTVLAFNATTGAVEVGPTIADTQSIADIKADIATLADIEDGTDATDAIQTVAGISANVTTVASNDTNVTTVAGQTTNMQNITDNLSAVQNAATNATTASTKATEAAASATAAATSETNAGTSETNAATSATNASTSATAASTSATAAASSATAAAASETAAAASETAAATSETNASTSATTATTKASEASTSATNAAASATSAASAQSSAESARDSALAAYDNFDDRYLGAKSSDPTVDNDGNALVAGALYFNTASEAMKVYTGSSWVAAYVSGTDFAALSGATFTGSVTMPTVDINGGAIDGTIVGGSSAAAGTFTTLTASGDLTVDTDTLHVDSTNDRVGIGTSSPDTSLTVNGSSKVYSTSVNNSITHSVTSTSTYAQTITLDDFGLSFDNNSNLRGYRFSNNGNERLRIDDSGNVGIGTDSPASPAHIYTSNTGGTNLLSLEGGTTNSKYDLRLNGTTFSIRYFSFDRFVIESNGRVRIGNTATDSNACFNVNNISYALYPVFEVTSNTYNPRFLVMKNAANSEIGSIRMNSNTTSVSYNTTSDYRLKENVVDITDGITRVKQLDPKRFNFISDPNQITVDGFLAHEVETIVPEAVSGTHNEVDTWKQEDIDAGDAPDGVSAGDNKLDDDGNTIPVYQGIDQAKLVPLLTAALQEAIAKIETLETKVAALEAE